MKVGDFVELKIGTKELYPPENIALVLGFEVQKKRKFVKLFTIKGRTQVSAEKIRKNRKISHRIQLRRGIPADSELRSRLQDVIQQMENIGNKKDTETQQEVLTSKSLWEATISHESRKATDFDGFSIVELTEIWFENNTRSKRKEIEDALSECKKHGVGYFFPHPNKNNIWFPHEEETIQKVRKHIEQIGNLRRRLFDTVEEEDEETKEIRERKIAKPLNMSLQNDEDKTIFAWIQQQMAYLVQHDKWDPKALADSTIYSLDKFNVHKVLIWIAEDWIGRRYRRPANAFCKMLITTEYWTPQEALLEISKRHVRLTEFFKWSTPEEIEELAEKLSSPSEQKEEFERRTDLRKLTAYTIDPHDAKDFDDAISMEINKEKEITTLWVHIADVTHYVSKDSLIDIHAYQRATSVYLPSKVLPMLPRRLSEDLCSLRAKTPRFAMTVKILYDAEGNRIDYEIQESVIQVTENLDYGYVNQKIEEKDPYFLELYKLSKKINEKRRSLFLETPELRLTVQPTSLEMEVKTSSNSTKMIETFMVAANEVVSEALSSKEIPAIYRCHPLPDQIDVDNFNERMKIMDLEYEIELPLPPEEQENKTQELENDSEALSSEELLAAFAKLGGGNISVNVGGQALAQEQDNSNENKDEEEEQEVEINISGFAQLDAEEQNLWLDPFQTVLKQIEKDSKKNTRTVELHNLLVLRVFGRAFYNAKNIGHFGLGSVYYSHFTSPIRRYPDVILHRQIKQFVRNKKQGIDTYDNNYPYTYDEIKQLADHCSSQNASADYLQQRIVNSALTLYVTKNEYPKNQQGVVSSVRKGGTTIILKDRINVRIPHHLLTRQRVSIDPAEAICYISTNNNQHLNEEINAKNWRKLIEHEPIDILLKIGDNISVTILDIEPVDGYINVQPTKKNKES